MPVLLGISMVEYKKSTNKTLKPVKIIKRGGNGQMKHWNAMEEFLLPCGHKRLFPQNDEISDRLREARTGEGSV